MSTVEKFKLFPIYYGSKLWDNSKLVIDLRAYLERSKTMQVHAKLLEVPIAKLGRSTENRQNIYCVIILCPYLKEILDHISL